MTSIASVNPQESHGGAPSPRDPAIWVDAAAQPINGPDAGDALAVLNWPRWGPGRGVRRQHIGQALLGFAQAHRDRPLLVMAPGLLLQPQDARTLAAIAGQCGDAVVISVLSNSHQALNPFAGLDVSRVWPFDATAADNGCVQLASLVRLLGPGKLHPLDFWPEHLLFFSPQAIGLLAAEQVTTATACAHLQRRGGRLIISDSLFAADAGRPADYGPDLQAHEERRPAPWGDLTAGLAQWLNSAERLPEHSVGQDTVNSLHITHSWGGGVAQWVESFIDADRQGHHFQLRSEGPQRGLGAGQRLSLYTGNELNAPVVRWWLNPPIRSSSEENQQYREILGAIRKRHGIGRIIVSSLVGHSLDALRSGLPTVQVLHDFYPGWPLLGVHPGPFLAEDREQRLQQALRHYDLLPDFRGQDAPAWNRLADRWHQAICEHEVKLAAPSESVARMLRQLDKRWRNVGINIIHHGMAPLAADRPITPRKRADGKLRLVIPGRIQEGKGQALLLAALPRLTQHAQVYLLGAGKHAEVFFGKAGVNIILQYQRRDLPRLMQTIGADVAALLSLVPETFSYTLSEMHYLGIPVIATRVGSLAERIQDGRNGWLIEPNADALTERVGKIAANRHVLEEIRENLRDIGHFSAADMVQRYDALCPARASEPDLTGGSGLVEIQQAALAEQNARLRAEKTRAQQKIGQLQAEIERRTEWAMERQQALLDEQQQRRQWVDSLEAEIRSGREAVKREQEAHARTQEAHAGTQQTYRNLLALHQTVLQSASWRITRPLRVSRRILTNLALARAWNPARWPLLLSQAVRAVSTQGFHGAIMRLQHSSQQGLAPAGAREQQGEPIGDPQPPQSLPRAARPAVSVIIPVYNQWVFTAACLRSIAHARCEAGFEVIVVDDHSQDHTPQRLSGIEGLEFIRNPQNTGFVGSCNRGAEAAAGEYIVLLNNDTQVPDGWLDALLETFERFPDTGLAGARLVYPDGRLQEAGGIVFRDGSGWNYGRGDRADRPEYACTREVDYCSGACVMLPTALFRRLGGFDQRYAPAYYEDTDLAFRVREAGFKVRLQAAATVIHHEGITAGTDTGSGAKRFQDINHRKFLERWRDHLQDYPAPIADPKDGRAIRLARDHRLRGRVLVIDAYTPEPDQDSGSLRLRYLFDCFQQLGYGVSFFADNRGYAGNYSRELQKSGVEVLYNPWIASLQEFFQERGGEFDVVMISRHYVAVNYISLIQRYCPQASFIFDTVDLHYLREQRLAALENSLPLKRVAAQTRRSELAVIRQAAVTLVVSEVEQTVLAQDAPQARVEVLSNIHRVSCHRSGFSARKDILFVGGFQHPPNIDAAQWFVGSVWPLIRQQLPDVRFHLIGSKAPDKVRALHGNGVEFHGFVKDLQPYLDGCRLAVAPLRYGAGVKGKVNLSMSRGQPVVATPMAVEGLYARDGEDVLIADSAREFAAAVIRLYRDEALWNRLSEAGQENVRRHFSLEHARERLSNILDSLH